MGFHALVLNDIIFIENFKLFYLSLYIVNTTQLDPILAAIIIFDAITSYTDIKSSNQILL